MSSDESSAAGRGVGGVGSEGIESVGEGGENAGTATAYIRVRVLHEIEDRKVPIHGTLRLASTSTCEPVENN